MATPTLKQQENLCPRPHHRRLRRGDGARLFLHRQRDRRPANGGAVLLTGIMALVGLGYSAFYTRSLSRIAEAEKTAGGS